ncbi:MAG: hypothetical protein ACFFD4_22795 [Candidatus Odinarchaeota archaeon]
MIIELAVIADTNQETTKLHGGVRILAKTNRYMFSIDKTGYIRKMWKLTGIFIQMKPIQWIENAKGIIIELKKPR